MKVRELITALQICNPEATVEIVSGYDELDNSHSVEDVFELKAHYTHKSEEFVFISES